MLAIEADLTAIFANGDFDDAAVFAISDEESLTVYGWFTAASQSVSPYDGNSVVATQPSFTCPTRALEGLTNKRSVVINGTTYTVQKMEPTGVGTTLIWLKT